MTLKLVEKLGRAGNSKNRDAKLNEWNTKYGEGNWEVVYSYKDNIMTREEALREYYYKSYYLYMDKNKSLTNELCNTAKSIYNPHAENTGGVDLQCPAVMFALGKLGITLSGSQKIAIGTWGSNKGIKYPSISYKLSPFKVPLWCDDFISVEKFWQEFKYLAVKI